MIVYLNQSIESLQAFEEERLEELASLLLECSITGLHQVIISRPVSTWILDNLDISGRHKAHLEYLIGQISTSHGLINANIINLTIELGTVALNRQGNHFHMGHINLLNGDYLRSSTVFLTENAANDVEFYRLIFDEVKRSLKAPQYNLVAAHGGGSTTPEQFSNLINSNRIVVAIVDNDKKHPNCGGSNTFRRTKNVSNETFYLGDFFTTHGAEVENYLPYHILTLVAGNGAAKMNANILRCLDEEYEENNFLWHHYDVKDGVNGNHLIPPNPPGRGMTVFQSEIVTWWANKLQIAPEDIAEFSAPGFGEQILSNFLNSGVAVSEFVKCIKTDEWKSRYFDLFVNIYWFLCASQKRYL